MTHRTRRKLLKKLRRRPETAPSEWAKPKPVTDLDIAAPADTSRWLPAWDDIPEQMRRNHYTDPWCDLAATLFHEGGNLRRMVLVKPGIDFVAAVRQIKACLGSFEPKHEHKIAGVGYLMSLWFERPARGGGDG